MYKITSQMEVGGKAGDLSNFGRVETVRLMANGSVHQHCTLVDKVVVSH